MGFHQVRSRKMFWRILLLLLAMTGIMFLLTFFYLRSFLERSYRERTSRALFQLLQTADEYVEQSILDMGLSMQQELWNADLTHAVLLPGEVTTADKVRITRSLSTFAEDHPLAENVWLFTYADGMTYSSGGDILPLENSGAANMLPEYRPEVQVSKVKEGKRTTDIYTCRGRVLLLQPFPMPEHNGALAVELRQERLLEPLQDSIEASGDFLEVWGQDGTILAVLGSIDDTIATEESWTGSTGWKYRIRQNEGARNNRTEDIVRMIGLWIVLFLVAGLAGAVLVSGWIYRPFGALEDKVDAMAPYVRERLYMNLLNGHDFDPAVLRERMTSLASPFQEKSVFRALAAFPARETDQGESRMSVLYERYKTGRQDGIVWESLLLNDFTLVLIISRDADISVAAQKQAEQKLIRELKQEFMTGGCGELAVGRGGICQGVENLHYSYREAGEDLRRQIYAGEEKAVKDDTQLDAENIRQRIVELSKTGKAENAGRILAEYAERNDNGAEAIALMDSLIGELLNMGATSEELEKLNDGYRELETVRKMDAAEDLPRMTLEMGRSAIQMIESKSKSGQYRYVAEAKRYIEAHCQDSTLSQEIVAQNLGINCSYLSRLFKEYNDENFVSFTNRCRVEHSCRMLRETRISVQEIGFHSGFNSLQNFNRVFKKYTGVTPGAYRKQAEETGGETDEA